MVVAVAVAAVTDLEVDHLGTADVDSMGTAACRPRTVGVVTRVLPSAITEKVTVPAPPVSSSTPTSAVNREQFPPR